jgi:hypothetical protein
VYSADDISLRFVNNLSSSSRRAGRRKVEKHGLSQRSTRSSKFHVGATKVRVTETRHAVFVQLLSQRQEHDVWVGVSGVQFQQVERLFLHAAENGAPLDDVKRLGVWFLQSLSRLVHQTYNFRFVIAEGRHQSKESLQSFQATFEASSSDLLGGELFSDFKERSPACS